MRKKTLCLILALVMVFSLLPGFALNAAAAVTNPNQADKDDLHMDKNLVPQDDGTYNIVLRSWSTGVYSEEQQVVPKATDYVLVLDLSESMGETNLATAFEATTAATFEQSYKYTTTNDPVFIKTEDGKYRQLIDPNGKYGNYHAYYVDDDYNLVCITSKATNYTDNISQNLLEEYAGTTIYRKKTTESRLQGLKDAVEAFLEQIHAADQGLDKYRVAVTGFSGKTYIYSNGQATEYSQAQYDGKTNPADPLKYVTSEYEDLTASKDALAASSSKETYTNYGLQTAYNILDARTDAEKADRDAVVLLFSDGLPNQADHGVAMINTAKDLEKDFGATVFSISVYKGSDYQAVENWYDKDDLAQAKTYVWQVFEAISSNFPDAVAVLGGAYDVEQCKITMGERVSRLYYTLAGDSKALEEAFKEVVETSTSTESTVTANANSTLTDVINQVDFSIENASVKSVMVEPVKLANADDKNAAPVNNGQIVPFVYAPGDVSFENGTLDVKGFDYSAQENIVTTHGGNRLVVTIQGLVPLKNGELESNTKAGIYPELGDVLLDIGTPKENIQPRTVIMDYAMKAKLATGQYVRLAGTPTEDYGKFSVDTTKQEAIYTPDAYDLGGKRDARLVFDGVDSALVYGKHTDDNTTVWKQVNVLAASAVYYDDDFLAEGAPSAVLDGTGYNATAAAAAKSDEAGLVDYEQNTYGSGDKTFTFYGDRVDIYCTTDNDASNIVVQVLKDGQTVKGVISNNNFYDTDEVIDALYNIPTVSVKCPSVDTYTVRILANDQANYRLDGVRIYHGADTSDADVTAAYNAAKENNATYIKLRDCLLDESINEKIKEYDLELKQYQLDNKNKPGVTPEDLQQLPADQLAKYTFDSSVVFYTDHHTDDENASNFIRTRTYQKHGPKNEIYLAKGEGIALQIADYDQYPAGAVVRIGLSAPAGGSGSVVINGDTANPMSVESMLDMYYPVSPKTEAGKEGCLTIENNTDELIAVTNLKISGVDSLAEVSSASPMAVADETAEAPAVETLYTPKLVVTPTLLAFAKDPQPDVTVADDPAPVESGETVKPGWDQDASNPTALLKEIFKLLLQRLFDLFSGLGNW